MYVELEVNEDKLILATFEFQFFQIYIIYFMQKWNNAFEIRRASNVRDPDAKDDQKMQNMISKWQISLI